MISIGRSLVQPRSIDDPGSIGPYQVLARLGSGGFGVVYAARAEGRGAGRLVAVKRVHPNVADDSLDKGRFEKEIRSMERVKSSFVPQLVDSDSAANPPWLVTELIPGLSLAKVVDERGPLPAAAVWRLGTAITEALTAIHAAGCVHRDLKPQNVILVPDRPWVIDFGLAHVLELPRHPSSLRMMATPKYAAPEQLVRLGNAGWPADIFELGGTLLFAATGHAPHETDSQGDNYTRSPTELPNLSGLPRGPLRYLVDRCLRYTPAERPKLDELRAVFDLPTAGREVAVGFADVLPGPVIDLLDDYEEELADVLGGRGLARLGWRGAGTIFDEETALDDAYEISALHAPEALRPQSPLGAQAVDRELADARDRLTARGRRSVFRPGKGSRGEASQERSAPGPAMLDRHPVAAGPSAGPVGYGDRPSSGGPDESRWPGRFDAWICGPVAIHGDTCLVTCRDGSLWRINPNDVGDRWRRLADLGGPVTGAAVIMPRRLGFEGAAFVAAYDGSVRAIDPVSGEGREVLPPGPPVEGSPVLVRDRDALRSFVYVVRADGSLYRIDPRDASSELLHRLDGGATGAMAAAPGIVAAADVRGTVDVLDADIGRVAGQIRTQGQVFAAPVIANGYLCVAATDGQLRTARLRGVRAAGGDSHELGTAPVHAALVYDAGRLYVGASDGRVHAFGISARGDVEPAWRWTDPLKAEVTGLAVASASAERGASAVLYVAVGYRVVEIDSRTGQLMRVLLKMKCLISAAPVISGGFCYVTGLGGVIQRVPLL